MLVGSSRSALIRLKTYFSPSAFIRDTRLAMRYFYHHGFTGISLTIDLLPYSQVEKMLDLEQYYIDALNPLLNVITTVTGGNKDLLINNDVKNQGK